MLKGDKIELLNLLRRKKKGIYMEYKTQEHLDYIEQAIEEFYNSIHEEDNEQFYKYSNAKLLNFNIAIKDIYYYDIIELVDNQIFPNIKESLYRQNLKETLEKRYRKLTYLIIANLYNAYFNVEQLMYYRNSIFYNKFNRECIISPNKNLFTYTMTTKVISALS